MKRSLYERTKQFFVNMGRRSRLLKGPAIVGLAISMILHHFFEYCRRGTKRFVCAAFILLCFMVGNSFAFPVFQYDSGFVSGEQKIEAVTVSVDSDITFADEKQVSYEDIVILEDEDVLDGYEDIEHYGLEDADKYLLDDIISEEQVTQNKEPEPSDEEEAEPSDGEETDSSDEETDSSGEESDSSDEESTDSAVQAGFSEDDWKLMLINKHHPIPDDYTFTLGPIKTIKGEMKCDERIIEDLLAMMQAAYDEDGIILGICSPYRNFNYQQGLFNKKIKIYMGMGMSYMDAYALASQTVTVPGASEHEVGLAVDMVSDTYSDLDAGFADTDAGKWLKEHCCEYGFILRYPKDKEYITSIEFEPWHFRYVGRDAATIIMEEGLCLEEFWDKYM
ncbi:MAG: M15 family metallopeptidase [Lachnospiraceae bacterium]|nr:M15 family metallopeptidase [Lachnospiraceae bacterium]